MPTWRRMAAVTQAACGGAMLLLVEVGKALGHTCMHMFSTRTRAVKEVHTRIIVWVDSTLLHVSEKVVNDDGVVGAFCTDTGTDMHRYTVVGPRKAVVPKDLPGGKTLGMIDI